MYTNPLSILPVVMVLIGTTFDLFIYRLLLERKLITNSPRSFRRRPSVNLTLCSLCCLRSFMRPLPCFARTPHLFLGCLFERLTRSSRDPRSLPRSSLSPHYIAHPTLVLFLRVLATLPTWHSCSCHFFFLLRFLQFGGPFFHPRASFWFQNSFFLWN